MWDHTSREEFYEYYARESQSEESLRRFRSVRETVLRFANRDGRAAGPSLDMLDIGSGAGTQCLIWAELGHRVHGLDVNQPLVDLARKRAESNGYRIDFRIGSASDLPWDDRSMDVCLVLELLEHVEEWEACMREFDRVLRPGGILFLTTTNRLCPLQHEFNLPLYGWYPASVKRRCVVLSKTTKPELANYATYPAVNWFSYYDLLARLQKDGYRCYDRFDLMDLSKKGVLTKGIVKTIREVPVARFLAHVATSGTILLAMKGNPETGRNS